MALSKQAMRRGVWLRLWAYGLLVHVVAAGLLVTAVNARADAALLRLGTLVMDYADATHQQPPRTVLLNGAQARLSVGATTRSVSDALDHFQRRCAQRSGGLGKQLRDALVASGQAHAKSVPHDALLDGIYRVGNDTRGVVACLDLGEAPVSMAELAARVQRVTDTGDLSQLGNLRFVSVERGDQRTVFVALWTDGPINVRHMFPSDGDAPGIDAVSIPRPAGARRVLSAWETGQDKAVHAYTTTTPLTTVRRGYLAQLRAAGFQFFDDNVAQADGAIVQRADRTFAIAFSAADTGTTLVTISSLDDATGAIKLR